MITVVLTIHSLIVLALIGVVLLQRSEGGALGMGGGGGGFMTGRGAATALTRTTSVLAALFFTTSIALAIFADRGENEDTLIEELTRSNSSAPAGETGAPSETSTDDLLRTLGAEGAQSPTASDMLDSLGGQSETPAEEDAAPADEPASETPPAGTEDAPAQNEPQPEPQN